MSLKLSNMVTSRDTRGELQKKDGEEALAQPENIPHRVSPDLGEDSKLDHSALGYSIETPVGFETAREAVTHLVSLAWTKILMGRKWGLQRPPPWQKRILKVVVRRRGRFATK